MKILKLGLIAAIALSGKLLAGSELDKNFVNNCKLCHKSWGIALSVSKDLRNLSKEEIKTALSDYLQGKKRGRMSYLMAIQLKNSKINENNLDKAVEIIWKDIHKGDNENKSTEKKKSNNNDKLEKKTNDISANKKKDEIEQKLKKIFKGLNVEKEKYENEKTKQYPYETYFVKIKAGSKTKKLPIFYDREKDVFIFGSVFQIKNGVVHNYLRELAIEMKKGEDTKKNEKIKKEFSELPKKLKDNITVSMKGEGNKTILIFTDPRCPFCQKLEEKYPKLLKEAKEIVLVMFPLKMHGERAYQEAYLISKQKNKKPEELMKFIKELHKKDKIEIADKEDYEKFKKDVDFMKSQVAPEVRGTPTIVVIENGKENTTRSVQK